MVFTYLIKRPQKFKLNPKMIEADRVERNRQEVALGKKLTDDEWYRIKSMSFKRS